MRLVAVAKVGSYGCGCLRVDSIDGLRRARRRKVNSQLNYFHCAFINLGAGYGYSSVVLFVMNAGPTVRSRRYTEGLDSADL